MLSSGDFSKVTGLSVKALRLYHDVGILVPRLVDAETGADPAQRSWDDYEPTGAYYTDQY